MEISSGVLPKEFKAFTSAPIFDKSSTVFLFPAKAAASIDSELKQELGDLLVHATIVGQQHRNRDELAIFGRSHQRSIFATI